LCTRDSLSGEPKRLSPGGGPTSQAIHHVGDLCVSNQRRCVGIDLSLPLFERAVGAPVATCHADAAGVSTQRRPQRRCLHVLPTLGVGLVPPLGRAGGRAAADLSEKTEASSTARALKPRNVRASSRSAAARANGTIRRYLRLACMIEERRSQELNRLPGRTGCDRHCYSVLHRPSLRSVPWLLPLLLPGRSWPMMLALGTLNGDP